MHGELVIVLHQDATRSWHDIEESIAALSDRCLNDGRTRAITVVVGPEGGIAPQEIEALTDAGAAPVLLGRTVLRASSAGPAGIALVQAALGRWRAPRP